MDSVPILSEEAKSSDLEALFRKLETSEDGLGSDEAKKRAEVYGFNEIESKKASPVLKFLGYFWGPIPWMIEVALVLSALIHHWADLGIILVLLLMNALVGFWEEYQADNTIESLKAELALTARVKRDGKWVKIPSREVTPGDIIRIRIGEIIPADAKLLDGDPLEVDQSALTGESLPVTKEKGDTVYSGSVVKQGEIEALCYATGKDTFMGKAAGLVEEVQGISHFQKAVLKIGDYLIVLALILVLLILTVALFRGDSFLTTLQFALILTIAAIPVAMPAVLSVTMAVGAGVLAKKKAIVSRLAAVEEMAGIDILCSDKTGTLTQNKLTMDDPFCLDGVEPKDVILSAGLASREEDQDSIDSAVLTGVKKEWPGAGDKVLHFMPFDPVNKRTEAVLKGEDSKTYKVTKGAPQVILALCEDAEKLRDKVEGAVGEFARRGYRSLGVARAEEDGPWRFLGVVPLFDPPREDSKTTIDTAQDMGIEVKMVTGDQLPIAKEIARKLGLRTDIMDAGRLVEHRQHEAGQVNDLIEKSAGFAQVFPEHKYHIVEVLQQRGHIVAMTGDGVNDAPALKKADAGIAVSGATDAARSAADIVLLTPGLSVIVDAVKESRKIFQRMNNYAVYRIAETIRVLLFMTLSILIFNFYPVTAVMIVLLALLNDGPILSIAFDNTRYSAKPEVWDMTRVMGLATVLGITGVIESFILLYLGKMIFHLDREMLQTLIFLKLTLAGHLTIFVTRTRGPFWSIRPGKFLLWSAVSTKFLATLAAVYGFFMVPIGWKWSLMVWGYALGWFIIEDMIKLLTQKAFDRTTHTGILSGKGLE